jgi:hypothetical protein
VQGGPDPKLSVPTDLAAAPGESLTIPVLIDSIVDLTGTGLESADLVMYYDAGVLEIAGVQLGTLLEAQPGQWLLATNHDPLAGRIIISLAGIRPLEGFFQGELVRLQARVKETASGGSVAINLAASAADPSRFTQLNEGYLTLIPAPTDAANDPGVDGRVTIHAPMGPPGNQPMAAVIGSQLVITGTGGNDHIIVGLDRNNEVMVRINQTLFGPFSPTDPGTVDNDPDAISNIIRQC